MSELIEITGASAWRVSIPLKAPYSVAYQSYDSVENVVVRLETGGGVAGWGCASPDEHVTGETIEDTFDAVRNIIAHSILNGGARSFREIINDVAPAAPNAPAARAAFDIAVHDILGKIRRLPLCEIFGKIKTSIPTSITIGISSTERTLAEAEARLGEGFTILKVKGGANPEEDIERIVALNKHYPSARLWLDANQGYSFDDANTVADKLSGIIEFMEQPVTAKDIDSMEKLARECPIKIMADESVVTYKDAHDILLRGVKLINVKLMKSGGLAEAAEICDAALAAGAGVMIGCMDELPVSMAAAAHLALSHPAVIHADLDGHLDLQQEIASDGIHITNGIVTVPAEIPGLGVLINVERLNKSERIF